MTLSEFLLARIAEDEEQAINWTHFEVRDGIPGNYVIKERVLAECEAKRRIVEDYQIPAVRFDNGSEVWASCLYHLALPYADHAEFREEWRA